MILGDHFHHSVWLTVNSFAIGDSLMEPQRDTANNKRLLPCPGWRHLLLGLLAAALAALGIWWFGPWSAAYRYGHMDLVSIRHVSDAEPNNALAWREMGLRLAHDGDGALAEPALRRALELNPSDPEVGTGLGELLLAIHSYPEAFQVLRSTIAHHPHYTLAHMALGRLYKQKGSYQHAAEEFESVTAYDPHYADAWYEVAICYLQMQQAAKAQSAVDSALRQSPREAEYLALKGSIDAAVGNVDAGITASKAAADLAPRDLKIQVNLANILLANHRSAGDLDAAEAVIGKIEQIAPKYTMLPYLRGELEQLRQNWLASARYLEMAIETAPSHNEAYFALSQSYRRLNRVHDADRLLTIYRKRQDIHRRIEGQRIALASQPNNLSLYVEIADLQMQYGDRAGAVSTLEAARQIDPKAPQIQRMLAQLKALSNNSTRGRP